MSTRPFNDSVALITGATSGIGRATVPAHSPGDGDLVFALSTESRALPPTESDLSLIGHAASLCLSRAIARAAYCANPMPGDLLPCWKSPD